MGTFSMPNQGAGGGQNQNQVVPQNDDSMWQDPNGDLRKWQRDTGTSIWGDPAKQSANCYFLSISILIIMMIYKSYD